MAERGVMVEEQPARILSTYYNTLKYKLPPATIV